MTATTDAPSVFEAGLPLLEYDVTESPHEVSARIQAAQRQRPIAIGPFGPEILSYDLARNVLRDTRFVIPPGLHLAAQGVTSGPLWDRVAGSIICAEGAEHHRLRSLVSRAFTPRATARLHDTIGEVVNELSMASPRPATATLSPILPATTRSRSSAHCSVRLVAAGHSFPNGPKPSSKWSTSRSISSTKCLRSLAVGPSSTPMSMK